VTFGDGTGKAGFGRLTGFVVLQGRLTRRGQARPQLAAPLDLLGLGVKLDGHQAEPFGAAQVKAAPGNPKTVFGLAAKEFGGDHID
jgi:hypothetical protein